MTISLLITHELLDSLSLYRSNSRTRIHHLSLLLLIISLSTFDTTLSSPRRAQLGFLLTIPPFSYLSSKGRIFLGGDDGHVYELMYYASERWGRKKLSRACLTSSLTQYLPTFIPTLMGFQQPSPIEKIVVDDERNIFYSVSEVRG